MNVARLEVLVEEFSAERALGHLLPRVVPGVDFDIRTFRGKPDLLKKLPGLLAGYATYVVAAETAVVVLVDRDDDDCRALKKNLENMARGVGLLTASTAGTKAAYHVVNRIAIEELEAWFFGDVDAVAATFPGVPRSLGEKAAFRDPDAIAGGTAEALERVLQGHGHHKGGLRKAEAAHSIATHMNVDVNRSASFSAFRDGVRRLVGGNI